MLGHHRDIEYYSDSAYCMDSRSGKVELHACTHHQGSQYFRYDLETKQMKVREIEKQCLETDADGAKILIVSCNPAEIKQKWEWGHVNEENLRNWQSVGAKMLKIV